MIDLLEPLIPSLRRFARAMVRNVSAADDLVQDCLERAISRWHQRRPDGNTRAWLFSILSNLAVDQARSRRRRGHSVDLDEVPDSAVVQPPDQEWRVEHTDVLRALEMLPEEQRSVLLLVSVEDLSYAEASEVLGVPIGTIMSRLSRGRARLRTIIEQGDAGSRPHLRRVK